MTMDATSLPQLPTLRHAAMPSCRQPWHDRATRRTVRIGVDLLRAAT
ncbi:hypothetical protein KIPE111705_07145 [Kibdelosporangium persicum]